MVRSVASFLEFCYLVRRSVLSETSLREIETALADYHVHRDIFVHAGVRPADGPFNLPRQHSMKHYVHLIRQFGAPNGLCSSITESKHIKVIKGPYRRSNRHNEMGQMLTTNQRLDKLTASRVDFEKRGMLVVDPFAGILPAALEHAPPEHDQDAPNPRQDYPPADADLAPVDIAPILGEVKLAATKGMCFSCIHSIGIHCL